MKRPNPQHPRVVYSAVFSLAALVASTAMAQVQIPASYKAPPGSYNTGSKNFSMRIYQTVAGSANTIAAAENRLKGVLGPNIATSGPNPDGSYTVPFIDYDVSDASFNPGDPVSNPGYNNLAYPGINNTPGAGTNFAVEVIGFLNLPAGIHHIGVRCNDSMRFTIGIADNPFDYFALQPAGAVRSPGGAAQDNIFSFEIVSAGVYPIRLVHGQAGDAATIELYYTNKSAFGPGTPFPFLINDTFDPNNADSIVAYAPASLPITPARAYVSTLAPFPGEQNVFPKPTIRAEIVDAGTTVNTNTIVMTFDGVTVSPAITQTGAVTYVTYEVPTLLVPLSSHTNGLSFSDSGANVTSNAWTFLTQDVFVIPASWGYPAGSGNPAAKGFSGKVNTARKSANFTAVIASTDQRLKDLVIDPNTGLPFSNLVQTVAFPAPGSTNTVNNDFTYTRNAPINYSMDNTASAVLDNGFFNTANGKPDAIFPGLPGADDETRAVWSSAGNMAWAEWAWVELPAGLLQIYMGHFDAGQVAIHANDPRDIFRESVVIFNNNGGDRTDSTLVYVEQAGIYGFRTAMAAFGGGGSLWFELSIADPLTPGSRKLVGDPADAGSFPAFTQLTVPTRPYIDAVRPDVASSGAALDATIEIDVVNLGSETPVMRVNGQVVSYTTNVVGNVTTLTYTPAAPFRKAAGVNVELSYGNTTSSWNFFTTSGFKALVMGAEDPAIRERLAAVHKLDVTQTPEASVPRDATYLSQFALIWNSEAVNSGNARPICNILRTNGISVPLINVEGGNIPDVFPGVTGSQSAINSNYWSIIITAPGSYLAGGLTGTNSLLVPGASNARWHRAPVSPAYAIPVGSIGTSLNGDHSNWGVRAGTDNGAGYVYPGKRVQLATAGSGMISQWNDNAWALFDAAVEWVLPPRLSIAKLANGTVELKWTGEGQLQESTSVGGAWTPSGNQNNPQQITPSGTKLYRVLAQ